MYSKPSKEFSMYPSTFPNHLDDPVDPIKGDDPASLIEKLATLSKTALYIAKEREVNFLEKNHPTSNMTEIVCRVQEVIGLIGQQLHARLGRDNKNICFSPLTTFRSICLAVEAMEQEVQEDFLASLGLQTIGLIGVRTALKVIFASFNSKFILETTHSIASLSNVSKEYTDQIREGYATEIQNVCTTAVDAVKPKNHQIPTANWLDKVAVIGSWIHPFPSSWTSLQTFDIAYGTPRNIPAMKLIEKYNYYSEKEAGYAMLEIPLQSSEDDLSCLIFLPYNNKSFALRTIEQNLKLPYILARRKAAKMRLIALQLPRIDMDIKTDDLLSSLFLEKPHGIKGIAPRVFLPKLEIDAQLGKVVHQAKIQFGETGTKETAKTAVEGMEEGKKLAETAVPFFVKNKYLYAMKGQVTEKLTPFIVNHAFAFVIMHGETILLQGSVGESIGTATNAK